MKATKETETLRRKMNSAKLAFRVMSGGIAAVLTSDADATDIKTLNDDGYFTRLHELAVASEHAWEPYYASFKRTNRVTRRKVTK